MLLPMIFKKEIHELKLASVMLFIAIFLFVVVFIFQLISAGTDQNDDDDFKNYY
jgi:RsiW-degrading membrane proteinase PrsW (M82 family)